jgi:dienelactone hydrolase
MVRAGKNRMTTGSQLHAGSSRWTGIAAAGLMALLLVSAARLGRAVESSDPDAYRIGPLNEQVIRIPVQDHPSVALEVTIMHTSGDGPFPLVIMNHGATNVSSDHRGQRYHLTNAAFYFLSRGYAVALPMMRGFAASGGDFFRFGCDLGAMGIANATDIRTVIHTLGSDSRFDTSRVIVAGQSFGGWNTLALGALNMPNVKGLVNFSGGVEYSDCASGDKNLVAAAGYLGAATNVPSIWFYGDNDEVISPATWRSMFDRYTKSGGQAKLVDIGTFMTGSHQFLAFPESQPLWIPQLDIFLLHLGMPASEVNPGYLPEPFPPATNFAAVTDVAAIPYLSDVGRQRYRAFLQAPFPRVFVIDAAGDGIGTYGGFDPLGRAMTICQHRTTRCGVYAVDDHVVWKPLPDQPQNLVMGVRPPG